MKKVIILLYMISMSSVTLLAQNSDYKVVFDMTSKDSMNQQSLIRELNLIKDANPDAKMEVVVYSHGLELVLKNKSPQQNEVAKLVSDKNISFKVCAMTMKRNNIDQSQLIPGVMVVPDGIYEIISKQKEGWGYIKVSR